MIICRFTKQLCYWPLWHNAFFSFFFPFFYKGGGGHSSCNPVCTIKYSRPYVKSSKSHYYPVKKKKFKQRALGKQKQFHITVQIPSCKIRKQVIRIILLFRQSIANMKSLKSFRKRGNHSNIQPAHSSDIFQHISRSTTHVGALVK